MPIPSRLSSLWLGGWASSFETFTPALVPTFGETHACYVDAHEFLGPDTEIEKVLGLHLSKCEENAPIIAWSLGSLILLKALEKIPDPIARRILLLCPILDFCGSNAPGSKRVLQRMARRLHTERIEVLNEFWKQMVGSNPLNPTLKAAWFNHTNTYSTPLLEAGLIALSEWKVNTPLIAEKGFDLTFMGDPSDPIAPFQLDELTSQLPSAKFMTSSSGHFPFLRDPGPLQKFLASKTPLNAVTSTPFQIKRFNRAAPSYNNYSQVQIELADRLVGLYQRESVPKKILELGCGTGHLTEKLARKFKTSQIAASDGAPEMVEATSRRLQELEQKTFQDAIPSTDSARYSRQWVTLSLDATAPTPAAIQEKLGWGPPFDMVASNALVQWFPDLKAHFEAIQALIISGGCYLVSGFLNENLPELREILGGRPFFRNDFPGHSAEQIQTAAEDAGFVVKSWRGLDEVIFYSDATALLKTLSGLGANLTPKSRPLTRTDLSHLKETYRKRYSHGDKVRATWSAWAAWLIRK